MESKSAYADRKYRLASSLIACGIILLFCLGIIIYFVLEKQVEIIIDGNSQTVSTFAGTVGQVLEENKIELYPCDAIDAEAESTLGRNQIINITRAFQVQVTADGITRQIISVPLTVEEAISRSGIKLGEEDIVSLPLGHLIEKGEAVKVSRIETKYISEELAIEPSLERRADNSLEQGITKTLSKGKAGLREDTYMVSYEDGVEFSRELVESVIVKKPQQKIIAYGTISLASREGRSFKFKEAKTVKATAYTQTGNSRTAGGTIPRVGVIAVDPRVIPLHSEVYVEGYGFAKAEDTGGH